MNKAIEIIKKQMERGIITLTQNGEFWKNAVINNNGSLTMIQPRRMEVNLKAGYLGVVVWENGKQYMTTAHRAAWTILKGEIPKNMDLNHKDGNKKNNDPANLEVVTRSENLKHAYNMGLIPRTDFARDYSRRAKELRKKGMPFSKIAKILGISATTAYRACNY